ncbi:hypothetical protein AC579_962 [Pseudocercospora musae]|uniref:Uncharacterized protein n=1 Tax=Pseudocercospora musae TaxID=113226 RepID=A0A139IUG2_9PEZI|nr:hypothetical protein AC579_962 [Pseudocercospora musae]
MMAFCGGLWPLPPWEKLLLKSSSIHDGHSAARPRTRNPTSAMPLLDIDAEEAMTARRDGVASSASDPTLLESGLEY